LRELYKSVGGTLDWFHGEPECRLPMPARYVIDKEDTFAPMMSERKIA
jgi:hypothetical protein